MRSFKRTAIVIHLISSALALTWALEVAPNSACSSLCMDRPDFDPSKTKSSSTQTADLYCEDWQYRGANSTSAGRKWKSCIECESSSNRFDPSSGENDVYWFLCKAYLPEEKNVARETVMTKALHRSQYQVHCRLVHFWVSRQSKHDSGIEHLRRCLQQLETTDHQSVAAD